MMPLKPEAPAEAPIDLDGEQIEKVTLSGRIEERESRRLRQTDRKETMLYLVFIIFFTI